MFLFIFLALGQPRSKRRVIKRIPTITNLSSRLYTSSKLHRGCSRKTFYKFIGHWGKMCEFLKIYFTAFCTMHPSIYNESRLQFQGDLESKAFKQRVDRLEMPTINLRNVFFLKRRRLEENLASSSESREHIESSFTFLLISA